MIPYCKSHQFSSLKEKGIISDSDVVSARKYRAIDPIHLLLISATETDALVGSYAFGEQFRVNVKTDEEGNLLSASCSCRHCDETHLCKHAVASLMLAEEMDERDFASASKSDKGSIISLKRGLKTIPYDCGGYRYIALCEAMLDANEEGYLGERKPRFALLAECAANAVNKMPSIRLDVYRGVALSLSQEDPTEVKVLFIPFLRGFKKEYRDEFCRVCLDYPALRKAVSSLYIDYYDDGAEDEYRYLRDSLPVFSWRDLPKMDYQEFLRFLRLYKGSKDEFTYICRLYKNRIDGDFLNAAFANPEFPSSVLEDLDIDESLKERVADEGWWSKLSSWRTTIGEIAKMVTSLSPEALEERKERLKEELKGRDLLYIWRIVNHEAKKGDLSFIEVGCLKLLLPYFDMEEEENQNALIARLTGLPQFSLQEALLSLDYPFLRSLFLDKKDLLSFTKEEELRLGKKWDCLSELGIWRYARCIS